MLFHSFLFYLNRVLRKPNAGYSYLATGLAAIVLGAEVPQRFLGTAWLVLAAVFFEVGLRKRLREFRWQGYAVGAVGAFTTTLLGLHLAERPWISLVAGVALLYATSLRVRFLPSDAIEAGERRLALWASAAGTGACALALLWRVSDHAYTGLSWWLLAVVLFELGLRGFPAELRVVSYVVAAFGAAAVVVLHLGDFVKFAGMPVWLSYAAAAAAAWAIAVRMLFAGRHVTADTERRSARALLGATGSTFLMALMWLVMPDAPMAMGWAGLCLLLLGIGSRTNLADLRWQSYVIAALAFIRCAAVNLSSSEGRLPWVSAVVASFFAAQCLASKKREPMARVFFSVLGTVLLAALLYQQVSGGLLTVAWGLEGLALLAAGFRLRERVLRLEGLALFVLCVLKLFLHDLRNLETPYRILSFLALDSSCWGFPGSTRGSASGCGDTCESMFQSVPAPVM